MRNDDAAVSMQKNSALIVEKLDALASKLNGQPLPPPGP